MMRLTKLTALGAFATALALSLTVSPAPLQGQETNQRGERRAAGVPVQRGPVDVAPADRAEAREGVRRGPIENVPEARGPMGPGPAAGPAAGLVADVVRFWDRPAVSERLALTEDQIAKLQTSFDKARPTIDEHNAKMRQAGQKIAEAMREDAEPDMAALRKAVDEFASAQKASMMAAVEHRATLQTTLNDNQLADLRQMRARLRAAGDAQTPTARPREAVESPRTLPDLPGRDARGEGDRAPRARGEWTPEMRERMRGEREGQGRPDRGSVTPEEREEMRERMMEQRRRVRD